MTDLEKARTDAAAALSLYVRKTGGAWGSPISSPELFAAVDAIAKYAIQLASQDQPTKSFNP